MSKTVYSLPFSICVEDMEHWSAEHSDQYVDGPDGVADAIAAVMRKAGNDFIDANPDLFVNEVI